MRRHFWVLGLGVAVVCALLGYSGAHQLADATDFDLPPAPPVAVDRPAPAPRPAKDGDAMVARNIFCSDCQPVVADDTPIASDGDIPLTSLPLELLATSVAAGERDSFATVRNSGTDQQGAYWIGDRLPGAGAIERVGGTTVVFHNPTTRRLERLTLLPTGSAEPSRHAPSPRATAAAGGYADHIRASGDNRYEVDAALVKQLTENPMAIKGVRFMPHVEGGKVAGFRLGYARPDSIATAMGLRRGDVVQAINGHELTSADALLDVYTKLRDQRNFQATVLRNGKPVTLAYDVR